MKYDYLIVGAGFYGAIFAYEMQKKGKNCLVLDKRKHIGGNCYTESVINVNVNVHTYGAHIFHTSDKEVWDYVNSFVEFNRFTNSPVAKYYDELYSLPFNMNTFNKLWGVITPDEAKQKIEEQKAILNGKEPENLEEQAISLVGTDIYEKLIKNYTEKQWGRDCKELPPFIIKRLPVRFTYDNNYFNDKYQGIPEGGYTKIFDKLLENVDIELGIDFLEKKEYYETIADKIVYTGPLDEFYAFEHGVLEYRSLTFEHEVLDKQNFQGNAVVNYNDAETKFTRIIEHKHFEFGIQDKTVITKEYPSEWKLGDERYYPVNDEKNTKLYEKYKEKADAEEKYIFGGRLADYKYYDMHQVIRNVLDKVRGE